MGRFSPHPIFLFSKIGFVRTHRSGVGDKRSFLKYDIVHSKLPSKKKYYVKGM